MGAPHPARDSQSSADLLSLQLLLILGFTVPPPFTKRLRLRAPKSLFALILASRPEWPLRRVLGLSSSLDRPGGHSLSCPPLTEHHRGKCMQLICVPSPGAVTAYRTEQARVFLVPVASRPAGASSRAREEAQQGNAGASLG